MDLHEIKEAAEQELLTWKDWQIRAVCSKETADNLLAKKQPKQPAHGNGDE